MEKNGKIVRVVIHIYLLVSCHEYEKSPTFDRRIREIVIINAYCVSLLRAAIRMSVWAFIWRFGGKNAPCERYGNVALSSHFLRRSASQCMVVEFPAIQRIFIARVSLDRTRQFAF